MKRSRLNPAAKRGFMLIEVMVSVLIFTIGVLALVGLQGSLAQAQATAKVRADAAFLANELIGTMWADMANMSKYTTETCGAHPRCKEWQDKVATGLPSGVGEITIDNASEVSITVKWTPTDGSGEHQYRTYTNLVGPEA